MTMHNAQRRMHDSMINIDLCITYTAVCGHEPDDCSSEWSRERLIPPHQLVVEVGSFRQQIFEDLVALGWTLDRDGGWLCPDHSSLVTHHSHRRAA